MQEAASQGGGSKQGLGPFVCGLSSPLAQLLLELVADCGGTIIKHSASQGLWRADAGAITLQFPQRSFLKPFLTIPRTKLQYRVWDCTIQTDPKGPRLIHTDPDVSRLT